MIHVIRTFLFTLLIFYACQNNIGEDTRDNERPSFLKIVFDDPITRGVGTPTGESQIIEGTAMAFNSLTGALVAKKAFSSVANPLVLNVWQGTYDVYVVANTNMSFTGVTNVSQLKNYTTKYALASINSTGANLPMSGKTLNINATTATVSNPASAVVQLHFLCAKVAINWSLNTSNTTMNGFSVGKIYLLNSPSVTDYFTFGSDNLTSYSSGFNTGMSNFSTFSTGTYYPQNPYTNTFLSALLVSPAGGQSGNNFFYVFENKSNYPVTAVVEGTITNTNVTPNITTTYYYPVVINGTDVTGGNGTATVLSGVNYTVNMVISGPGNSNPYNPITPASVTITITAPTWTPAGFTNTVS